MNIEVNFNNLTKEEQEQFKALVEKANKPKSKVWKPEENKDWYYFLTPAYGEKCINYCFFGGGAFDKTNYIIGNCFRTKEEAEFALERLKVIAEMKRYIAEHDDVELDWDKFVQNKYYLYCDHTNVHNHICIDSFHSTQCNEKSLYASSKEILENMIKEIGEERVKKYYFGVGE